MTRIKEIEKERYASIPVLLVCMLLVGCVATGSAGKLIYPSARKARVVDNYHGNQVSDPYRWLEDGDSAESRAWVEAQNRLTAKFVRTPARESIKDRLTQLFDFPRYSVPTKKAARYFFSKNDGLQNQPVFYVQESLGIKPKVLIDPNLLSQDGTVALTGRAMSQDGKLLAYLLSGRGSDWQKLKIREVDTGKDLPEVLNWCKFTKIAWKHDGSGFFYNRYPNPQGAPPENQNAFNRVYWHKLGTAQSEDQLVYHCPDDKGLIFHPDITEDGRYLLLTVKRGTDPKNLFYYRKLESDGPFVRLLDQADARYVFLGNRDTTFYFHTDLNAPKGRIVAIDIEKPGRKNWVEILGQQEDVVRLARLVGGHLVVAYMHHAHDLLKVFGMDGKFIRDLPLPGIGTVTRISGRPDDPEVFFGFTSFLVPLNIYRHELSTAKTTLFREPKLNFDPTEYETKQVFFTSKDKTRVPMFIAHKKGIRLDGTNPVLLYGYGGFRVSLTPTFSASRMVWLESGGVLAVANLRGGGEYGAAWHQAGVLGNKQNVFDDFIAAAGWLVRQRYTTPSKLAIQGLSNGGLLTAACMLQRPDLFGAVVSQVPVIDMLRYHKFSAGRYWVSDYGNAEKDPEHFKFLYAYSPLHNIRSQVAYPATLITTADTDDRVVPLHGKKFAAALQAEDAGKNPLLLRVETKAGHGRGKPISKRIEEQADIFSFLFKVLKMKTKKQG